MHAGAWILGFLALASLASVVARRPWTSVIARRHNPPEVWSTDLFRQTNMLISGGWSLLFAGGALLAAFAPLRLSLAYAALLVVLGRFSSRLGAWYSSRRLRAMGLSDREPRTGAVQQALEAVTSQLGVARSGSLLASTWSGLACLAGAARARSVRRRQMHEGTAHFLTVFMSFFAIMNPVANAPLFLGLTEDLDAAERREIALRAVLLAFAIVCVFGILGREIFALFGITLPAFRIAGGILVSLVGFHLLQGQESSVHTPTAKDNEESRDAALGIAISPLAMPILAGPGTIATAMNYTANAALPELIRTVSSLALVCALTWISFVSGDSLVRFLGRNAIKVVTRLMGLILAVIGVQMVIAGVGGAIAVLPILHPAS